MYKHRGPYSRNADGSIDCEVRFAKGHPLAAEGWMPFTAHADDRDPRSIGPGLFAELDPKVPAATPPTAQAVYDVRAAIVRTNRDRRLTASDWTQLPDVPEEIRDAWAGYRQRLRDVTEQPGFPAEVTWPAPPA